MFKLPRILLISSAFFKYLSLSPDQNQFIYHGFNESSLSLSGLAKVHSNGLLELTNISNQRIGRAFFPIPFKFNKSSPDKSQSLSFSTNFVFAIVPEILPLGGQPGLGGHGFAFTISPSVEFPGASALKYFGLFNITSNGLDSNHILAIEFDTIRHPDYGETNNNHVGIDVNGLTSNVSAPAAYFSKNGYKNLTLISGNPMQVWIDYNEMQMILNVTLAPIISMKPEKPLLSTTIDLSSVFLDSMYLCFSSSTGSMASYHYILGWSFNKNGPTQILDMSKLPSLPSPPSLPPSPSPPPLPPPPSPSGLPFLVVVVKRISSY